MIYSQRESFRKRNYLEMYEKLQNKEFIIDGKVRDPRQVSVLILTH